MTNAENLFRMYEAAAMLDVTYERIRQLVKRGVLKGPRVRIGYRDVQFITRASIMARKAQRGRSA